MNQLSFAGFAPWWATVLSVAMGIAVGGCGARPDEIGPPRLVVVESTVLEEADSSFIAEPGLGFAVDADGNYYLTDPFQRRLSKFDKSGRLVRILAGPGQGPGEFSSFQPFTWVRDSVVVQASSNAFKAFNHQTGRYLGQVRFGRAWLASPALDGERIYIPLATLTDTLGVVAMDGTQLLARIAADDTVRVSPNLIEFPPEYRRYRALRDWTNGGIAAWSDSLLVGYSGVPYLVVYHSDGTPIDTLTVPRVQRRGFPDGWLRPYQEDRPLTTEEEVNSFSYLNAIWRTSSGDFILWYQENRTNPEGVNPPLFGQAWISVMRRDMRTACVDARIDVPGTEWPVLGFHRDRLLSIDQVIVADSTRAQTVISTFSIDTTACHWLPVSHSSTR